MGLFLIILFLVLITLGPFYWWFRNIYRHFYKKATPQWDRSIKWVWIITTIIGIIIGFSAIFL